jgi:superfamily II DNA or RNA helicase
LRDEVVERPEVARPGGGIRIGDENSHGDRTLSDSGTGRLRDLALSSAYRSDTGNIVDDFYTPCLGSCVTYDRAVGYFSSSALNCAAKGLPRLFGVGGRMRLVASPELSEGDAEAIEAGYADREARVAEVLIREIQSVPDGVMKDRLGFLAWMIERELLDIRIALCRDGTRGLYHEKFGLFRDVDSDTVAFTGSPNESAGGLKNNFESIEVFCSWSAGDAERVSRREKEFERLWSNRTSNLEVIAFPEAARRELLALRPEVTPVFDPEAGEVREDEPEYGITLRDYQSEVIESWKSNGGRGVFELATGTGKTITALTLVQRLLQKSVAQVALVVVPFQHLVDQWHEECTRFGMRPIKCYQSSKIWMPRARAALDAAVHGGPPAVLVSTNSTFCSDAFEMVRKLLPQRTIVVGDEVHNFGSAFMQRCLPGTPEFRLGLSATPERFRDPEGTAALRDYFGPSLDPIVTVSDAIARGALTSYSYDPVIVELSPEEFDEYVTLTEKIRRMFGAELEQGAELPQKRSEPLDILLMRRARIVAGAEEKHARLATLIKSRTSPLRQALVYVGEARISGDMEADRQIEVVTDLLGNQMGLRVATITSETPVRMRASLIQSLASGELQALVAMRCLDEGIDIPCVRTAFIMSSSRNPRQYVQRRGRVLRLFPKKISAEIVDMVTRPPSGLMRGDTRWSVGRELVRRELERAKVFAADSSTEFRAWNSMSELRSEFDLLDV